MDPEQQQVAHLAHLANALERIADAQIRFASSAFERAQLYANLFIVAGYSWFFWLWSVTKDSFGTVIAPLSALLLLGISGGVFISYGLYQVALNASDLFALTERRPTTLGEVIAHYESAERRHQARAPWLVRLWFCQFVLSVTTGYAGVAVLLWSYVRHLLAP